MMIKKSLIRIAASVALSISGASGKPPNVVIFLADDQGWGDLSAHGNTDLNTPNIDSLAKDGASFDRFFVCAVCAPTRAEFFTGRYHPKTGVSGVSTGRERLNIDEYTLGEAFKKAGYATGAFGKWHNGTQYPNHPNTRGYDEFYGFTSGHWGHYFSPALDHNGRVVKGDGYITDDLTTKAMSFIKKQTEAKKPFLAYLPYCTPHSPMQVPDELWDRFKDKDLKMVHRDPKREKQPHKRAALAMVENVDWNVGRVLKQLEDLGLEEDTIVIYFSDNGPNGWRWNGDMRGKKGTNDEGGLRVPFFIRWPGKIPEGHQVEEIAGAIDIFPTLAELTGIQRDEPKPIDGVSLKSLLTGKDAEWSERTIFSTWANRFSLRTSQYRLSDKGELFDITADPGQRKDLASEMPEVMSQLNGEMLKWRSTLPNKGERMTIRPFLVGFPGGIDNQLPSRDGKSEGGIKRSSVHPNCSFFLNWTKPEDRIFWEVEVATTGDYEIELHYTCPAADVGSEIELSYEPTGAKVVSKITVAHDPPLVGAEQDRSPRTESLVKDFRILNMGKVYLQKGRGTLSLRALKIPGNQVADIRLLNLRKR
jgi:arylsulfatase A-like enzyme|tara:strand:+ start:1064 stop:2833 length:1770 start_codon:yes stop_codon:yes gene_type:complete